MSFVEPTISIFVEPGVVTVSDVKLSVPSLVFLPCPLGLLFRKF
jgi:hypothetical protein